MRAHIKNVLTEGESIRSLVLIRTVTPEEHDISTVLWEWMDQKLILNFETRDSGFLQVIVNDGEEDTEDEHSYKKSCSRIRVDNPMGLVSIIEPSLEKLRLIADSSHFVLNGVVTKKPTKMINKNIKNRISTAPLNREVAEK